MDTDVLVARFHEADTRRPVAELLEPASRVALEAAAPVMMEDHCVLARSAMFGSGDEEDGGGDGGE